MLPTRCIASLLSLAICAIASAGTTLPSCESRTQHIADPPYQNYFYSDCHVDAHTIVTTPEPDSNFTVIGPRLIIAWPAGNSGVAAFFQPQDGKNGTLAIGLVNSSLGSPIGPIYKEPCSGKHPSVGVEGVLSFNNSAEMSVAILGSVRTIRDFIEGPSLLNDMVQGANKVSRFNGTGLKITRLWLDNVTTTTLTIVPWRNRDSRIHFTRSKARFGSGFYRFSAYYNYPQLKQLTPKQILNDKSQALIEQEPAQVSSLSFFSYTDKLLAGGWRFLTYFGRDTLISALLLQPVLNSGKNSAMEAALGATFERINRTDGSICHEETIGDYATLLNLQKNLTSTALGCTYPMIDTDYYLPILMARYFAASPERIRPLLDTKAGAFHVQNKNLTWGGLGFLTAQKIMTLTAPFEHEQKVSNLIHLKDSEIVGQWRDTTYGIAGARIPFDVNTALAPAALHAISKLASMPGVFPNNTITRDWASQAAKRAKVWEDKTLDFFAFNLSVEKATERVESFIKKNDFYKGPTHASALSNYSNNGMIADYALAIQSAKEPNIIPVVHTDTAFRNFLLNTTDQAQLTHFINASANAILRPFPAGLTTPIGAVVANPALSGDDVLIDTFIPSVYHGSVVWSWQLALVAKGFELQLARCPLSSHDEDSKSESKSNAPAFCSDHYVYNALRSAYNRLWDVIEENASQLESEVWSWTYYNGTGGGFRITPLGARSTTESDVRQLWSLTFLAIKRQKTFA